MTSFFYCMPRGFTAWVAGILVAMLLTGCTTAREPVTFYSGPDRHELTFIDVEIGVVARDGIEENEIRELGKRLGWDFKAKYPFGLYVFRMPEPVARGDLVVSARELRKEHTRLIAQAGLVFLPDRAKEPLILTDEIIVRYHDDADRDEIQRFHDANAVQVLMQNPFDPNEYLISATPDSDGDALDISVRYHESDITEYAHPNFLVVIDVRQTVPNDTLIGNQWHHVNTGQAAGTVDADVDSDLGWDFGFGAANTLIAVLDGGFDMTHPDLQANYWLNAAEIAGNNVDDDGNTFVDDVSGWDFNGCVAAPANGCGDNNPTGPDTNFGRHGTSVAGATAAIGNNALGVVGTCPACSILPVRIGGTIFANGLSFGYAQQIGAAIITNSWGYTIGTPVTANVVNAINNAANTGSVVLFAMNTTGGPYIEDCQGATPDISSLATVIAVSASNNADSRTPAGYGNCMDIVAPTDNINAIAGTLWATTTDMQAAAGYNNNAGAAACPSAEPAPPPANARDYTLCFGGTSFATPVTAGVAGLVLSINPGLTRVQVQQLLQDTADKIEDSAAVYSQATGFSTPTAPPTAGMPVGSTHGFGRVNAFEAIRTVAAAAQGGRGGVDIFIRDNRLDWGNTEQLSNVLMEPVRAFIPHYRSVDIVVDAPPYQPAPTTSAAFDAFTHENPVSGATNKVYVRVHNRGQLSAASVTVKLHWTFAGTALPALATDFWTAFPADPTATPNPWNSLGVQTINNLGYSGASIASTAQDASQIVSYDWVGPPIDPSLPAFRHHCLFAVITSAQDPVSAASMASLVPDFVTPRDNNVTHRNVAVQDAGRSGRFHAQFMVRNPFRGPIETRLELRGPKGWKLEIDPIELTRSITLDPGAEKLVDLRIAAPEAGAPGSVEVIQLRRQEERWEPIGGVSYDFEEPRRTSDRKDDG